MRSGRVVTLAMMPDGSDISGDPGSPGVSGPGPPVTLSYICLHSESSTGYPAGPVPAHPEDVRCASHGPPLHCGGISRSASPPRRRSRSAPPPRTPPGGPPRPPGAAAAARPASAGILAAQALRAKAPSDEFTGAQDALRTGWDPAEPGLAPKVLRSGRFGRVFTTRVRGQVYAQPLVVGPMVIAATEQDWVYGIDAVTGRVHWSVRLGHPGQAPGCPDLQPRIGITGTPVYDPQTRMVNVVAETTRRGGRHAAYHLFAVNPLNGHVTRRVAIGGHPVNDPRLSFSAVKQLQRPALLLLGHWVLAAFGSHCDQPPYVGYVAAINPSTGRSRLWSDESGLTNAQGGIWQSGGGLMSDGPGRAFFTSGNGISPAPGPGARPPGQLGDAVVRLAIGRFGALSARDFFSPRDAPALAAADIDFGSGGPAGLPFGTRGLPHLLVQAGKDGRVFLLNSRPPGRPGAGTGRRRRGGQPGRARSAACGATRRRSATPGW